MSHKTAFTTQARVLLCQQCGAPIEVANAGGLSPCSFCHAQNRIVGRSETGVAPARQPISEQERFARLSAQCDRPWILPESIKPFYEDGVVPDWKMDEALAVWKQTRTQVESTHDSEAAERLFALTIVIAQTYGEKKDPLRHRAMFESSLDVFTLPRHRQAILCGLSRGAIGAKDGASAEEWLRLCDARSDDIESDSEYRHAWATIHTHRAQFDRVLEMLGDDNSAVPIQLAMWDVCTLFRAHALERLGRVPEAIAALREAFARSGGRERMAMVRRSWEGLCPVSYAQAEQAPLHTSPRRSVAPIAMAAIMILSALSVVGVLVFTAIRNEEARVAAMPVPKTSPPPVVLTATEPPVVVVYADMPGTKQVVSAMRSRFKKCFDKGLAANPKLSGSSVVVVQIDGAGKVTSATATGSFPADVNACLQKEVTTGTFPPPKEGRATLSIPAIFGAK